MHKQFTKREKEVLHQLMVNGRATDHSIARTIHTSRPTVAKVRKRLEDEQVIMGYHANPNYRALGLTLYTFILFDWKDYSAKGSLEKFIQHINSLSQVISFMQGQGIQDKSMVILSAHPDLEAFDLFITRLKEKWGSSLESIEIFFSTTNGMYKKHAICDPAIASLSKDPTQTYINSF